MTSSVRYADVINGTGAVLTTTTGLIIDGKDGGLKTFKRIFAAIDVGVEAGKTRDATDPTKGCLICQVKGANIKQVVGFQLFRPANATNQVFDYVMTATTDHYFKYGLTISPDGKGLYIHDAGDDAATRIVADDYLMVSIITGNY